MKVIITCGPSFEPIDQARRLTNFSTGRTGIVLANLLAQHGCEITCLKGEQASCCDPLFRAEMIPFSTNQDLLERLQELAARSPFDAVLHAAALCDFRVGEVFDAEGNNAAAAKISTRSGELLLRLVPTVKVLPQLRALFPSARIVGWKYELVGTRENAFARAWRQIDEADTDACVLNGAAYGDGFAVCSAGGSVEAVPSADALASALFRFLQRRPPVTDKGSGADLRQMGAIKNG